MVESTLRSAAEDGLRRTRAGAMRQEVTEETEKRNGPAWTLLRALALPISSCCCPSPFVVLKQSNKPRPYAESQPATPPHPNNGLICRYLGQNNKPFMAPPSGTICPNSHNQNNRHRKRAKSTANTAQKRRSSLPINQEVLALTRFSPATGIHGLAGGTMGWATPGICFAALLLSSVSSRRRASASGFRSDSS